MRGPEQFPDVGERNADRDAAALRKELGARARNDQRILRENDLADITLNWAPHPAGRKPPSIFERGVCGPRDVVPLWRALLQGDGAAFAHRETGAGSTSRVADVVFELPAVWRLADGRAELQQHVRAGGLTRDDEIRRPAGNVAVRTDVAQGRDGDRTATQKESEQAGEHPTPADRLDQASRAAGVEVLYRGVG
jgi:hypothetical protein